VIFFFKMSGLVGDEAIAHRLSREVGVNVLLIHSIITSRSFSSRKSLYIVQDDHDRSNGKNSAPLL